MPGDGGTVWTAEELAALGRMTAAGLTLAEIAAALGRTADSVRGRLRTQGTGWVRATAGDERAERPCLRCRRTFRSEGPHNRVCPGCRSVNAGIVSAGPVDCGLRAPRRGVSR